MVDYRLIVASLFLGVSFLCFFLFGKKVTGDLVWYNNSDQNSWALYSTMDFNDGQPANLTEHTGVGVPLVYGLGFRLFKLLGYSEMDKTSDFKNLEDPVAYIPGIYKNGVLLSKLIIFLCSILIGAIVYMITGELLIALFGISATVLSGGFLFHSAMVRAELSTIFYLLLSIFFYVCSQFVKPTFLRIVFLVVTGFFVGLSYFTKAQIFLLLFFFCLIANRIAYVQKDFIAVPKTVILCSVLLYGGLSTFLYQTFNFLFFGANSFWSLIFLLLMGAQLLVIVNAFYPKKNNHLVYGSKVISFLGIGFLAALVFLYTVGLRSDIELSTQLLNTTTLWGNTNTKFIDHRIFMILRRFFYFLYFNLFESSFIICLLYAGYSWIKKKELSLIFYSILGICLIGFFHSLRITYLPETKRTVYKYLIFTNIPVLLLVCYTYKELLQYSVQKMNVHLIFWGVLFFSGVLNFYRMPQVVDWNFNSRPYSICSSFWFQSDTTPKLMQVLNDSYTGHMSGHDRVILGNEIPRIIGTTERTSGPGGTFMSGIEFTHELTMKYYLENIRMNNPDIKFIVLNRIKEIEHSLWLRKIELFKEQKDYRFIATAIKNIRVENYKNHLSENLATNLLAYLNEGKLTAPF